MRSRLILVATLAVVPVMVIELEGSSHAAREVAFVANWLICARIRGGPASHASREGRIQRGQADPDRVRPGCAQEVPGGCTAAPTPVKHEPLRAESF